MDQPRDRNDRKPEIVNAMLLAWLDGQPVSVAADISSERLVEPAA